jgi:hypothetical protein
MIGARGPPVNVGLKHYLPCRILGGFPPAQHDLPRRILGGFGGALGPPQRDQNVTP